MPDLESSFSAVFIISRASRVSRAGCGLEDDVRERKTVELRSMPTSQNRERNTNPGKSAKTHEGYPLE
jgi:hypothetical protein